MELVYLWVEEYKNIKKQGFNFSPRFKCKFDGENLIIDEKKDYVSIFPDNINITAIVGENGSGKSSICGELFSVIKQDELKSFEYYMTHSVDIIKGKGRDAVKNKQLNGIKKFFKTKKIEVTLPDSVEGIDEILINKIVDNCKKIADDYTHKRLKFILLISNKNKYQCVTNMNFKSNQNIEYFNTFYSLKEKKDINIFCALGEFSTRENHKGGEFVDSFYSILPLQRKEIINAQEEEVQNIINKIQINFDKIQINTKGLNKVLFNNNIPLGQLSFGEKYRIILYIQILNRLNKYNNSIIFLDEVTISLHPRWQKTFVNEIIELFSTYHIHFMITSHSPFILSDIPKENVIFLKKDKDSGNCLNITNKTTLNTFGANIHTLLSDGFFMSDGLMGEFAKGKIEEIKNLYFHYKDLKKEDTNFDTKKTNFESKKERFRHIQSIIGDPFLQTVIKNYLDELEILFNGKKKFLDKEIQRLQDLRDNS